jgi:PilZ domain-containing protein
VLTYEEKRKFIRMEVDCDLTFKFADSDQVYQGRCTSLSGSGVAFTTDEQFDIGIGLEIRITPKNPATPPMIAFVEIVRTTVLENGSYKIGALIKSIQGT